MRPNYPGLGVASLVKQYSLARPYQRRALNKLLDERLQGLVSLPTGAGKTLVGTMAISVALGWDQYPVLVLVPTRALAEQWLRAINTLIPGVATKDPGEWGRNKYPVLVTTYQYALHNPDVIKSADFIVVDEAHHIRLGPSPSYEDLATKIATKPYKLGLTAMPAELLKDLKVTKIFGPVVYSATPRDLAGFLQGIEVEVKTYPGARIENVPAKLVAETAEELSSAGKNKVIVFVNTVSKAKEIVEALRKTLGKDYKILEIYGTQHMSPEEQTRVLKEFREAKKAILVGTTVLNEGIDLPEADAAIIATPTGTEITNIQRIGRVIRPAPGKGVVPVVYLAPRDNKPLLEKLETMLEKYFSKISEEGTAKELEEIQRALKEKEKRLGERISTIYYPLPEGLAKYITDLMIMNPNTYTSADAAQLQSYLYYYYLNIYGDPKKAYQAWIRDISRKGRIAGSIRDWILSPGPRPSPSGKLPGKDIAGVDAADLESLKNLGLSEEELAEESKKLAKLFRRLAPQASGIILSSEEFKELRRLLGQVPETLRNRVEKLLLLPLSSLSKEDVEVIMEVKAITNPKALVRDVRSGFAGFCTVAAWLLNKCPGIPPVLRKSEARKLVKKALEEGVGYLLS